MSEPVVAENQTVLRNTVNASITDSNAIKTVNVKIAKTMRITFLKNNVHL